MKKKQNIIIIVLVLIIIGLVGYIIYDKATQPINNCIPAESVKPADLEKPADLTKEEKEQLIKEDEEGITLEKKKNGRAVVYFFRGQGCSYCAAAKDWFDSIEEEYGNLFVLVDYEVWYSIDNENLMKSIAESRGETIPGVPYIIIGDKSWFGYTRDYSSEMLEEIKKVAAEE